MSGLDKIIAAVTPPESADKRAEARAKARDAALPGGWLSLILDHHDAIEQAFDAVHAASDATSRTEALKQLGTLLNGHSMAEEAVIYPALAQVGEKGDADMGYTEQVAAKMQMGALEIMDPLSQDFEEKLKHLEGAVAHHIFSEEDKWLVELEEKATPEQNERIKMRYEEEFGRYMGGELRPQVKGARPLAEPRSFADQKP